MDGRKLRISQLPSVALAVYTSAERNQIIITGWNTATRWPSFVSSDTNNQDASFASLCGCKIHSTHNTAKMREKRVHVHTAASPQLADEKLSSERMEEAGAAEASEGLKNSHWPFHTVT